MADARGATVSVRLGATTPTGQRRRVPRLRHGDHVPRLPRRLRGGPRRRAPTTEEERPLPHLKPGDELKALELEPQGHATTPPARYTEATLVQALEERGIGRPSTYASIIGTILDRGYVFKRGTALVPSFLAFSVVGLLEQHFGRSSTTTSPRGWRTTSTGSPPATRSGVEWLRRFYFGGGERTTRACTRSSPTSARSTRARSTRSRSATAASSLRVGRYGPYLERGEERASVPDDLAPGRADGREGRGAARGAVRRPRARHASRRRAARSRRKAGRYGPYVTEVLPEGATRSRARRRSSSRCRSRR